MGLFSKKKEIPVPSDPFMNNSAQTSLNDIPFPPADFSQNPSPAPQPSMPPMPPFDDPQIPLPQMPPQSNEPMVPPLPLQPIIPPAPSEEKELPAFDSTSASAAKPQIQPITLPQQPAPMSNAAPVDYSFASVPSLSTPPLSSQPSFELPDFDDDEINALENLQEQASVQKSIHTNMFEHKNDGLFENTAELEKTDSIEPEPAKLVLEKEKYLDIRSYFEIKECIDESKSLLKSLDDEIENHAAAQKTERYHLLTLDLNAVQDKLMQIDTKLFNG